MNKTKAKKVLAVISFALVICLMFAGCAPAADGAEGGSSTSGLIQMGIMVVAVIAIFYFFSIRPERKRKKEAEEMKNSLSVGDPIVTIGGMVGKIVEVSGETITFETSEDQVRIEVKKWAISKKEK